MIRIIILLLFLLQPAFAQESGQNNLKVAAIVNNYPITIYDIEQRMKLIIATTGLKTDAKTAGQLANRVLNNLIDEQLQMQEAEKNSIKVTDEEIDAAIAKVEADNKKEAGSFLRFLASQNIDQQTMREQVQAQIAWGKYLARKVIPRLQVSDSELKRHIEQLLEQQRQVEEVHIATIDIPNLNIISKQFGEDDAANLATKLTQQLRNGVDFQTLARQLNGSNNPSSIAPSWVALSQLPPELATIVRNSTAPKFIDPIKTINGYQIVFLQEKRFADYRVNAEVLFKEIILRLDNDANKQDVEILMDIARNVRKHSGSCNKLDIAGATDLEALDFEVKYLRANLAEISPQIFPLMRGLQVEETSEPFATTEGIRMLKLCEKTQKPLSKKDEERILVQLKEEKLRLESVRELRKLKRNSFIDVRN